MQFYPTLCLQDMNTHVVLQLLPILYYLKDIASYIFLSFSQSKLLHKSRTPDQVLLVILFLKRLTAKGNQILMRFREQHYNIWVLRESDTVWVLLVYTIYRIRLEEHIQEHDGCFWTGRRNVVSARKGYMQIGLNSAEVNNRSLLQESRKTHKYAIWTKMRRLLNLKSAATNNYHPALKLKMKCTIVMQHTEQRVFSPGGNTCSVQNRASMNDWLGGGGGSAGIDRRS
jgi:hypothetical protein